MISSIFGAFADRRELTAALNPIPKNIEPVFDYSARGGKSEDAPEGGFWFDFVADTADGWLPTHAVAQLVNKQTLGVSGQELPRGEALVFGGDLVYPTASPQAYKERLIGPWNEACAEAGFNWWEKKLGDVYAIPGNHDWYDGLVSFSHIFARRSLAPKNEAALARKAKIISGREANQLRSYFALKLPNDWWFWGTDSQIAGYIDQPQVDFFSHVARHWMKPKSRLIMCVGQPSWTYVYKQDPEESFNSFAFLTRLATSMKDKDGPDGKPMEHELKLVLTGDAHHYSRYVEDGVQYITAGGGGAFLHPTNHLPDRFDFDWRYPPPNQRYNESRQLHRRTFDLADREPAPGQDAGSSNDPKALYPPAKTSKMLALGNFGFAGLNFHFKWPFLAIYALLFWQLSQMLSSQGKSGLLRHTTQDGAASLAEVLTAMGGLSISSSGFWIFGLVLLLCLIGFADEKRNVAVRIFMGLFHTAGHLLTYVAVSAAMFWGLSFWGLSFWGLSHYPDMGPALDSATFTLFLAYALTAFVCAFASSTVFGIYLMLSLIFLKRHWNEAYSSLRLRGYKNFLRLKIDEEGVTVYPIGLKKVPGAQGKVDNLEPELIEKWIKIT